MAVRAKRTRKAPEESAGKAAKAPTKRAPAKRPKPAAAAKNDGRARLEAELKDARARIAELEKLNEEAVNRIDWVIDSLQTVLAEKN